MRAHARRSRNAFTLKQDHNRAGRLYGHMAIDAILRNAGAENGRHSAGMIAFGPMTGQTSLREQFELPRFVLVRVMTGETGHSAGLEAFAGCQHPVLVAMYVHIGNVWGGGIDPEIIRQPITRLKAERRFCFCQSPTVTKPAEIEALLARKIFELDNEMAGLVLWVILLECHVFRAGAMTFLAIYAI